jgi:hypothetical protein
MNPPLQATVQKAVKQSFGLYVETHQLVSTDSRLIANTLFDVVMTLAIWASTSAPCGMDPLVELQPPMESVPLRHANATEMRNPESDVQLPVRAYLGFN